MRKVQPSLKFVGMALALPSLNPHFIEYFLNHENHEPGVPLDFISYHFYAGGTPDETPEIQGYTFFEQADGFLNTVRYVETLRKRLSPETGTQIDEIGGYWNSPTKPIPDSHWYLTGALYGYMFGELTRMGIEGAGASVLSGFPAEDPSKFYCPDISMLDWNTGNPNPRFRVLQLIHNNFGPGDKVIALEETHFSLEPYIYVMPVITRDSKRRVLLVNKSQRAKQVDLAGAKGGNIEWVDQNTAANPPARGKNDSDTITLSPYAVAAVTLP